MNKKQAELIVYFNKNYGTLMLLVLPFMVIIILLLLFYLYYRPVIGFDYLNIVLQVLLGFVAVMFSVGYFYLLIQIRDSKPLAVLNQEGIWLKYYGFIPWYAIGRMGLYSPPTVPQNYYKNESSKIIGIQVRDNYFSLLYQQASWQGRMGLFWAKLFGYSYHAFLSCLSVSSEEVLAFASQWLKS